MSSRLCTGGLGLTGDCHGHEYPVCLAGSMPNRTMTAARQARNGAMHEGVSQPAVMAAGWRRPPCSHRVQPDFV